MTILPCEKVLAWNQEEGSHSTKLATASQTSSLQNCEKYISVFYKLPSLWDFVIAAQTDLDSFLYNNDHTIIPTLPGKMIYFSEPKS